MSKCSLWWLYLEGNNERSQNYVTEENVVGGGPDPGKVLEGDEGDVVDEHTEDAEAHLSAD